MITEGRRSCGRRRTGRATSVLPTPSAIHSSRRRRRVKYRTRLAHPTNADPLGSTTAEQCGTYRRPAWSSCPARSPRPVRPHVLFTPGTHGNAVRCSPSMAHGRRRRLRVVHDEHAARQGLRRRDHRLRRCRAPVRPAPPPCPTLGLNALDAVRAARNPRARDACQRRAGRRPLGGTGLFTGRGRLLLAASIQMTHPSSAAGSSGRPAAGGSRP